MCHSASMQSVAMKNVPFLALLVLGCTTSSAPVDGTDVGPRLDAPSFDAPSFDVPSPIDTGGPDIMAPLFDSGIRPDTGPRDAGPPARDVGPPDLDAGRPDTGPPDGGFCIPGGSYEATPDPSNPPVCSAANIDRCRFGTAGASVRLTCGSINAACNLDEEIGRAHV